jgi:hypothetical protein
VDEDRDVRPVLKGRILSQEKIEECFPLSKETERIWVSCRSLAMYDAIRRTRSNDSVAEIL